MQPVGSGGGRGYATSCMKPGTKTEAFYDPTKLKKAKFELLCDKHRHYCAVT